MSDKPRKSVSLKHLALLVLVALVAYLAFYPVPADPVAWSAPPAPGFEGSFAPSVDLSRQDRLVPDLTGAEALTFDAQGRLVTGLLDGRIIRLEEGGQVTTIVNTEGRPLGMVYAPDGTLYVADALRGLLSVSPTNEIRVLVRSHEGRNMAFVDDVDRLPDGRLVFTDASDRFGLDEWKLDLIEHRPRGRVFVYDPATQTNTLLTSGLFFANGVAASADGSFALVCETGAYRVQRIELTGPRAGQHAPVIENLPGFCDNIRRSEDGLSFFVALPSPRDAVLDATASLPSLRRVILRLPEAVQPAPKEYTSFIRIDGTGRVLQVGHATHDGSYGPATTAIDHGGALYFGSLSASGVARVRVP
ncbi:MAG: SMP-30/gluconolactonase/LRE family protein [Deltaproteobacteria bacterium]|nr:SMP-30/gluconolactonase/LRE family protein [Deltaproteobacteria bacterium]